MAKTDIKLPVSAEEANELGMLAPEEAKMTLEKGLEEVQRRNRDLNSGQIIQSNKTEEIRTKLIQSLFGILKEAGVDGNDIESINQFLQNLYNTDPDLAEMFELAFNGLMTGEDIPSPPPVNIPSGAVPVPGAPAQDNSGLMGKFNNLSNQTFRQPASPVPATLPPAPTPTV